GEQVMLPLRILELEVELDVEAVGTAVAAGRYETQLARALPTLVGVAVLCKGDGCSKNKRKGGRKGFHGGLRIVVGRGAWRLPAARGRSIGGASEARVNPVCTGQRRDSLRDR